MNIYIISLGSKSNYHYMFIISIRDVLFIIMFSNFWHSQLSILSRDADMVQLTCIWLRGQAIWILTSYTRSASCITASHLNSCLCFKVQPTMDNCPRRYGIFFFVS